MKPVIGICADYCSGLSELFGSLGSKLDWQLTTNDYIKAIEKAGGIPVIIPVYNYKNNIENITDMLDGLLFAGGSDIHPKHYGELMGSKIGPISPGRDEHELNLAKNVIEKSEMPVLGICRGYQLLNVACGGKLYQDLYQVPLELKNNLDINHSMYGSPKYNPVHKVEINKNSKFYEILNKKFIEVNSYHHQAIKDVADVFNVAIVAPDGIVEAIELKGDRFVLGTQWHPEMMIEHYDEQFLIFKAFVDASMKYKMSTKFLVNKVDEVKSNKRYKELVIANCCEK